MQIALANGDEYFRKAVTAGFSIVFSIVFLANCAPRSACQIDATSEACVQAANSASESATVSSIKAHQVVLGSDATELEETDFKVTQIRLSDDRQTLSVTSAPFDDNPVSSSYVRATNMDVVRSGQTLMAFVNPDTGYNNYVGYYGSTAGNVVYASIVGTPDYINYGHAGAIYGRSQETTFANSGQVELTGAYVGQRVHNTVPGMDQINGRVILQIDFSDNLVRGQIVDRTLGQTTRPLPETYQTPGSGGGTVRPFATRISLTETPLDRTYGTFYGDALAYAEQGTDENGFPLVNDSASGHYEGILGGNNGNSAAGVIVIIGNDGSLSPGRTRETGLFIAQQ